MNTRDMQVVEIAHKNLDLKRKLKLMARIAGVCCADCESADHCDMAFDSYNVDRVRGIDCAGSK
jgi:hypothetical protein